MTALTGFIIGMLFGITVRELREWWRREMTLPPNLFDPID